MEPGCDDGTLALTLHHRQDMLAGEERTGQIDVHDPPPFFLGQINAAANLGKADIVVEDIDPSPGLQTARDQRLYIVGAADIGLVRERGPSFVGDDGNGFFRRRLVEVNAQDTGPFLGEAIGGRLAVAPARPHRTGAEHDDDAVLKFLAHCSLIGKGTARAGTRPAPANRITEPAGNRPLPSDGRLRHQERCGPASAHPIHPSTRPATWPPSGTCRGPCGHRRGPCHCGQRHR